MRNHTFKHQLADEVAAKHGGECQVVFQNVPQNNGIFRETMTILKEKGQATPAIDLEPYVEAFQSGVSISTLADIFLAEFNANTIVEKQELEFFFHYDKVSDQICYRIINYEKNQELLQDMPHRRILDLALIYYYRFEDFGNYTAAIMVHHDHIKRWDVTEEQLYEQARKNTCRLLPVELVGLLQVIQEISEECNMDYQDMKICKGEFMYVLTNQERFYGAASFLYPGVAKRIAEAFSSNFFILPSSIHECIIIPDSGQFIAQELKELVYDVNRQCVEEEEILSDNVYYYDRIQQKLLFARSGRWTLS